MGKLDLPCPKCGAGPGSLCIDEDKTLLRSENRSELAVHAERVTPLTARHSGTRRPTKRAAEICFDQALDFKKRLRTVSGRQYFSDLEVSVMALTLAFLGDLEDVDWSLWDAEEEAEEKAEEIAAEAKTGGRP